MKENQKSLLLFVFALGVVLTYIISLFLPLPYTKSGRIMRHASVDEMTIGRSDVTEMDMSESMMQGAMHSMMVGLEGKQGKEFDKAFLEEMIVHHEGAIEMAKKAESSSHDTRILTLAAKIIQTQEEEVKEMKEWRELLAK